MKKMGYLQVILMIGCIPMLATMVALTVYASGKMKDELVDSTYLRLKACATSVEQYFTWDIREDIYYFHCGQGWEQGRRNQG